MQIISTRELYTSTFWGDSVETIVIGAFTSPWQPQVTWSQTASINPPTLTHCGPCHIRHGQHCFEWCLGTWWHNAITNANTALLTIGPLKNKFQLNLIWNIKVFFQENAFENVVCKMVANLFGVNQHKTDKNRWCGQFPHLHFDIVVPQNTICSLLYNTISYLFFNCAANKIHCSNNTSPLDKMATISQMIFSDAFSWMKNFVFWSTFHLSLFLRVQLTITQHWFR